MSDEQAVRQEQRVRRLREQSNGKLARALDPLVCEIGVKEVGKVAGRYARSEAVTVVGQRLVMIAGDHANTIRRGENEFENPQQQFEPQPVVVEEIAKEDDVRCRARLPVADYGRRGLQREQIPVEIADDPQRGCGIDRAYLDRAVSGIGAVGVEQQPGPLRAIKQYFKRLDRSPHPRP